MNDENNFKQFTRMNSRASYNNEGGKIIGLNSFYLNNKTRKWKQTETNSGINSLIAVELNALILNLIKKCGKN